MGLAGRMMTRSVMTRSVMGRSVMRRSGVMAALFAAAVAATAFLSAAVVVTGVVTGRIIRAVLGEAGWCGKGKGERGDGKHRSPAEGVAVCFHDSRNLPA